MGFFKKSVEERKVELPPLPSADEPKLPDLPPLPSINKNLSASLPSLPDTPNSDSFELHAIKSNIMGEPEEKMRRTIELDDIPTRSTIARKMEIKKEPVFVKLDKFKDSIAKFEEIRAKVSEIDSSLRKIKEVRDREDQELKAWEQKVQLIKEKVDGIDSSLFSRI